MPNAQSQSATHWKLGLALLATAIVACTVYSFIVAARRVGRVVDADYYQHGLHYGMNRSANAGVDWNISAALAGDRLRVTVTDGSGKPVSGGKLVFEPDVPATAPACAVPLVEVGSGSFQGARPASSRGTLRFTAGAGFASQKLVVID